MPLLPGWIVVETPQPIVQINRLTVEVPCKKSKPASAEQPNQVAADVLAEPMSIDSELVCLCQMYPVKSSCEYVNAGDLSSRHKINDQKIDGSKKREKKTANRDSA